MDKIFFIILVIISTYIAHRAVKKDKKFFLFFLIFILSFISGFRGEGVGVDTSEYYHAIINNFPDSWMFREIGFRFLSSSIYHTFGDPRYVFCIISFLTNSLVIMRLWDFRKKCDFSIMVFLYTLIYYFDTMNIMRQFLAVAILFYFSRILEQKKYLLYLVIIFLCTLIHNTSPLALLILLIYYWDNLTNNQKIIIFLPLLGISILSICYLIIFQQGHIENYFSINNIIYNINIPFLYRIGSALLGFFLFYSNIRIIVTQKPISSLTNSNFNRKEFKKIAIIYFIGLIFSSLGMFYFIMARLGYFYLIFELLFWGMLTYKSNPNRYLNLFIILLFAIYTFAIELIFNGSGIFPFYFNL